MRYERNEGTFGRHLLNLNAKFVEPFVGEKNNPSKTSMPHPSNKLWFNVG